MFAWMSMSKMLNRKCSGSSKYYKYFFCIVTFRFCHHVFCVFNSTVRRHSPAGVCDRSSCGGCRVHLQSKGEKDKHAIVRVCFFLALFDYEPALC